MNKTKKSTVRTLLRNACAASIIAALAPHAASAATAASAANAKILNVVTVTYYDANHTTSHTAAAFASVTVALKQAALTVAEAIAFPAVDSGLPTTGAIALTSNANGLDTYTVNVATSPSNLTVASTLGGIGTDKTYVPSGTLAASQTVQIGATSIVSVDAPVVAGSVTTQAIKIPGGTLNGIKVGSIVVINGTSYLVTGADGGSVASYDNLTVDPITGASTSTGALKQEVYGTITITTDPNGSIVTPALTNLTAGAGTIVGERKYLVITENGVVATNNANGTDTFSITTSNGSYSTDALVETATFYYAQLSIKKEVAFLNGGTGKPGDVLEYTITVNNLSPNGNANLVALADAVPAYTTLVSGSTYGTGGGTGAADIFATITVDSITVPVTLDVNSNATNSVGYGGTTGGKVEAATPISFFLGTTSSKTAGGTIAKQKTYTIKYQVKIN